MTGTIEVNKRGALGDDTHLHSMHRTITYLSDEIRLAIKEAAKIYGESEAAFIRGAIERAIANGQPTRPRLPLFFSGDRKLAEHVEDALADFGAR